MNDTTNRSFHRTFEDMLAGGLHNKPAPMAKTRANRELIRRAEQLVNDRLPELRLTKSVTGETRDDGTVILGPFNDVYLSVDPENNSVEGFFVVGENPAVLAVPAPITGTPAFNHLMATQKAAFQNPNLAVRKHRERQLSLDNPTSAPPKHVDQMI